MKYSKGLFIFRRDLRSEDNTSLNIALSACKTVITCFIFDPRQIGTGNEYRSNNAIQFMVESLEDLHAQLEKKGGQLYFFEGKAEDVVKKLIKQEKIDAIFCNRDYTPFSIKRDESIKKICIEHDVHFESADDAMINPPETVLTNNQTPYSIFTAYWKNARNIKVAKPAKLAGQHFYKGTIKGSESNALKKYMPKQNKNIAIHGGTSVAKKIVKHVSDFKNYTKTRDLPSIDTTLLSAHNKFGTVSIRQLYHAIGNELGYDHPLERQLYWRDFYMQVAFFSPFVYGHAFHKKYDQLAWSKSKKNFKAWCTGNTGFPIVDAGMRQLNQTGFMHNRLRMIVASFLVKDLHINWLWGEKYFAQQLVDYDPAVNNGNWQWSASTGCDAQPYFRIFNPWTQQKKFDPDCEFIKKWIPELKNVSNKIIHNWFKPDQPAIKGYPHPLVDHEEERKIALKEYKI